MLEIELAKGFVGSETRPLLVAEIGSNFNSSLKEAHELIDLTAQAGWDGVKFQLFRADHLYPPNCGLVDTNGEKVDFFEALKRSELPPEWLPELKQHAERRGLLFLCTPFDERAVDWLDEMNLSAYKIASPELNHLPLLKRAAATGRPLICSTGISTLDDIEEAIDTIRGVNPAASISLLHCVSAYPTPIDQANLAVIATLKEKFGVPVGFSDHTTDYEKVAVLAVTVGAFLIEKHVTRSRSMEGLDHYFAIEPGEMEKMAQLVREMQTLSLEDRKLEAFRRFGEDIHVVLGSGVKEIMPAESALYPFDKRSIHAIRDVAPGEVLSADNIRVLRSERNLVPGLHPRHWDEVLGARLTRPLRQGDGIVWSHLSSSSEEGKA